MSGKKGGNGAKEEASFEELLAEAEALSARMEDGGLSLDESIAAYEKGAANLKRCAALLRQAEGRVKVLVERDGVLRLDDFGRDGASGPEGGEIDEA